MIRAAVITGAHPYEVISFHECMRSLPGVDAIVQNLEDFVMGPAADRQAYDVLVFYNFHQRTPPEPVERPVDRRRPWEEHAFDVLATLGRTSQGILILHHALLAWPGWGHWSRLVGIDERSFGFHKGQEVESTVVAEDHPVSRGLSPWRMGDETYTMMEPVDVVPLVTYEHPLSMRTVAWAHEVDQARVVCYQAGHDSEAFSDPSFRRVIGNAISWLAEPRVAERRPGSASG